MPGQTPKYALPYPTQGDPLYLGASQMQALAVAIETTLSNMNVPPGAMNDPPSASAVRTSAQSIPNNVYTAVTFQAGAWDTKPGGSAMYAATGLTIRTAGIYLLKATWPWGENSTGLRDICITKNGTDPATTSIASDPQTAKAWEQAHNLTEIVPLASGDVLRLLAWQTSGVALNGGIASIAAVKGLIQGRLTATYLRPTPA